MPSQDSYGRILREARERDGYDLTTMARRLHIRPDILRAIEECDFDRMPAQGYTRNMVRAYARAVGLDQNAIADMYADAMHMHDTGRSRAGSMTGDVAPRRPSPRDGRSSRGGGRPTSRTGSVPSSRGDGRRERRQSRGGYGYVGEGRGAARQARLGGYPSIYSDMRNGRSLPSLPVWIIIAAVVLIVIIILVVLFNSNKQAVDDVPDIPISGLTDTSNPEGEQSADVADIAPTSAKLTFSIESGGRSWVEITEDGDTVLSETLSGPYSEDFDVTGKLTVRTANPDPIKITVDGADVSLKKQSGSEYYSYTLDFETVLNDWRAEHGEGSSSSSAASSSASSRASSASSSSSSRTSR